MSYIPNSNDEFATIQTLRALFDINRLSETLGYNVTYFAVGLGLAPYPLDALDEHFFSIGVIFTAVMLSKMQASIADALHDQDLDSQNPEKSYIAKAVAHLGRDTAFTLLVSEITLGLVLWSWLTGTTGTFLYIACGATMTFLGFIYSYPPRVKERGVFNHITTTGVDVACVVLPVAILSGTPLTLELALTLTAIICYTFAYHVLHQAGDTFYDREYGLSTFTQTLGIPRSILLASVFTLFASLLVFNQGYFTGGVLLLVVTGWYGQLYRLINGQSELEQSDYVSRWFHIGWVATCLNGGLAVSLLL
ncbi:UbiA family prenyltransferase [Halobium salinum]|uniref:UbiA family prenyltransferase n=1 Tax=Halobium salinum TaxID=1364940 RepID=A0ABD5PEC8_9EURY|nr:UbiA family prenyltransferase [Halobium salinum]